MKSFLVAAISIFFGPCSCYAQLKSWRAAASPEPMLCNAWEVVDVVYQVSDEVESPFDQQVFANIKGEQGVQRIPLFYNGNSSWVLRFSSSTAGPAAYVIESDIDELNGQSGKFLVKPNDREHRHGGIVLSKKTPNRFFYEDGTHYLNLAFECDWLFALDYGNADLPKTRHLLSQLTAHRFNQIVMNVYSYDVRWPKDPLLEHHPEHEFGGREDIFPFKGSNSSPDFSSLNVDFFNHFDSVISEMHEREIVSHLMIYVWNKQVAWPEMNSAADNMYFDYIVKRYQAFPNIVWDVSKEALHHQRATKAYILERLDRIRRLDSFDRLASVHDYGFCRNNSEQVDFISMQNWKHTLYQHMLEAGNEFPNKPIFNIEHGGYEESPYVVFPGAYTNAETCLRRNYMCLFAGGYTTYYWQGASWNVIIHNPMHQKSPFAKPHFEYFQHMAKLCEIAKFENCVPVPSLNSSGYNLTNRADGIVLMYAPKENHFVGINGLTKKFDCSNATLQWFNTLTGELTAEEPCVIKQLGFWDDRPWRYQADAVMIVRGLTALAP